MGQTCRDELLKAATAVFHLSGESNFTLAEILEEMHRRGSRYADSTIRTHVTSKMCANAPVHHANHTDDFERVGRGVYRSADRPAVRISYPRETSTPDTPQPATASEPFRLEPKFQPLETLQLQRNQDGSIVTEDPGPQYKNVGDRSVTEAPTPPSGQACHPTSNSCSGSSKPLRSWVPWSRNR